MKRWFTALSLALLTAAAGAVPAVTDVEAEVRKGNLQGAQTMMQEVVASRPNSARAHYVYAEILARNGRFGDAAREATLAKQIDPTLKFTEPEKFRAFEQSLNREQQKASRSTLSTGSGGPSSSTSPSRSTGPAPTAPSYAEPSPTSGGSSGVPGWAWAAGLGVLGVVAWQMVARRRAAAGMASMAAPAGATAGGAGPGFVGGGNAAAYGPGYGPAASGYGPGYGAGGNFGPGGYGGNRGGNLMGVGLAAAGGVAAGMLAEKMLSGGGHEAAAASASGLEPGSFAGDAGSSAADPGAFAAQPVDFGTGNNGWDDGGAADAGGFDAGGGDGGDGGGGDGW